MIRKSSLALLAALSLVSVAGHVHAQKLTGLAVAPAKAEVGQAVKVTTSFEVANDHINCKVRVHFGDGATNDFQVNQAKDVPLVLEHTYAKPGSYKLRVEGKGGSKCLGEDQHATLDVVAKAEAAKPAAAAKPGSTASVCPAGWALTKAGVAKKTGAFTCTAKAGTAIPEPKVTCPGDLTYFDNAKKGQLGCRV
jgi:PKD domain